MTVAPELDALLRACFAEPLANLPRLVLADYLDERGESDRATILRLQCELPPPEAGQKAKVKRGAGKDLKAAIARLDRTFAPLRRFKVPFEFVRGFLTVRVSAWNLKEKVNLRKRLAELCRLGWVETLDIGLTTHASLCTGVMPLFRDVGTLDCSEQRTDANALLELAAGVRPGSPGSRVGRLIVHPENEGALARLLGTPTAAGVNLGWGTWFSDLTPDKTVRLVESGLLDGTDQVAFYGDLGAAGVRALADSPVLKAVANLTLGHDLLTADVLRPLWAAEAPGLESLDLVNCPLGDAGVRELCAGRLLPTESLWLRSVGLTASGVRHLTACRALSSITSLNLQGNLIGEAGMNTLLQSPTFANVTGLNVAECEVAPEAVIATVFAMPSRPQLVVSLDNWSVSLGRPAADTVTLTLQRGTLSQSDARVPLRGTCPEPLSLLWLHNISAKQIDLPALTRWLDGQPVRDLRLSRCGLRNGDLTDLLALVEQVKPSALELSDNEIGAKGLGLLAASPTLRTVARLDLSRNPFTLTALLALAASPNRAALEELRLGHHWTAAEKKMLQAAFKGVTVD